MLILGLLGIIAPLVNLVDIRDLYVGGIKSLIVLLPLSVVSSLVVIVLANSSLSISLVVIFLDLGFLLFLLILVVS